MVKNWRIWLPVVMLGGTLTLVVYFKRKRKSKFQELVRDLEDKTDNVKKVILLGLDGSGKSKFMSFLSGSENSANDKPTEGFNVICQNSESLSINYWEIGGQEKLREYWPNFFSGANLVLFFIDSTDQTRFLDAKNIVQTLTTDKQLTNVPFMFLINKKDKSSGKSDVKLQTEVETALGIKIIERKRKVEVKCCDASQEGDVKKVQEQIKRRLLAATS